METIKFEVFDEILINIFIGIYIVFCFLNLVRNSRFYVRIDNELEFY